jgi:hypothetical protein
MYLISEVIITTVLIKSWRKSSIIVAHETLVLTDYTGQPILKPKLPTLQKNLYLTSHIYK